MRSFQMSHALRIDKLQHAFITGPNGDGSQDYGMQRCEKSGIRVYSIKLHVNAYSEEEKNQSRLKTRFSI